MQRLPLLPLLTTERLLLVLLFMTLMLGISGYSSDVFLHLAAGKYMAMTGALPAGDPFSFTAPGARWVMHEWLWQVVLYWTYAGLGFLGLKLLGASVLVVTLYVTSKSGQLLGARPAVAWSVTIVLFFTWFEFIGVRPHVVTYLFFATALHALLRYRMTGSTTLLYLLPLMMVLWVNSHAGYIVGLILLIGFIALHALERRLVEGQWPVSWLPAVALAFGACLINPYGYEQLLFPFHMMHQPALGYITEWQPLDIGTWQGLLYLVGAALFLLTLPILEKTEQRFRLLLVLPFFGAAFEAMRHVPLCTLVMAPLLADQISRWVVHVKQRQAWPSEKTESASGIAGRELGTLEFLFNWLLLGGTLLALYVAQPAYVRYESETVRKQFPIDATHYLIEHRMEGRMFTTMEFSTYILFARFAEQKLFYDVRVEMFGEALAKDYITMVYALDGWQRLFDKYAIDYAVLDKAKPVYAAALADRRFTPIYQDATSAVFLVNKPRH